MSRINIDIDKSKKRLTLSGDIAVLRGNRFAWSYFINELKAKQDDDNLYISISDEDATDLLIKVNDVLHRYGFNIEQGASSNKVIQDFTQEENNFKDFSKRALVVRNFDGKKADQTIIDDFNNFQNVVANNLVSRSLYPLQLLASYHMAFAQNSCNFSVPGAGKTSIVYAAYSYLKSLPKDDPKKVDNILIVGPLSSFGPWELEFEECFGKKPTCTRITGSMPRKDRDTYLHSKNPSELTLISYQSLPNLLEQLKVFLKLNRVMVVLDEAHKAKNTDGGVIAQSVLELSILCKSRIILTGTPSPNGYQDLYNMFKFIWPNKNVIGFPLNRLYGLTKNPRQDLVLKLTENISPFFIRIKKSDLGLPKPKFHDPIVIEMGPIQRQIYDFIERQYMEELMEGDEEETLASKFKGQLAKARLIRLMQAASNPIMLKSPLEKFFDDEETAIDLSIDDSAVLEKIANYEKLEIPPKFEEALKIIKDIIARGEKVVVWAIFITTINKFADFLNSHGVNSKELYGIVPVDGNISDDESEIDIETREKIIKDFHNPNSNFKVIIANPFAVAESISLHKACNNAIYLEKSFDAARFVQSKDRIHRVGLAKDAIVNYYNIITERSIDETIEERLAMKERRMIEIMESQEIPLFCNIQEGLGSDDIKALIRDYVRRTKK